ncbi:MAG: toll/interleukin-1 receptor domain-containing protein [Candidatus Accumulibacter meliphilus]|jgi:hypothetical protein|uniref:Toll/interleukin-1 receptor domain-containing protein n=1 Tax=Candidatus Accumulibacter meliphilus TaxID=2211374 RepID=A0A369XFT5_9PROT|nr:MAG: toll/interleukin-1 receptor domain-containing protein [Candidatus Accumulibacter meliphilus]
MRIFISYAGEHRSKADAIVLRLRQAGHSVFFDRDALPPAESYDERIRRAIDASDALVFLVSPESVTSGAYALTELEFARRRWEDPSGKVLPVMIADTDYAQIPAYLRAVTVLEPQGNVEAETAAAVTRLVGSRPRRKVFALITLGLVIAILLGKWLLEERDQTRDFRRIYFANFDEAFPSTDSIWLQGQRSDWEGSVWNGSYRLCNVSGNPNASFSNRLAYFEKSGSPTDQSDAKASVKVRLEPPLAQHSGAGLLYRKGADDSAFYVFLLSGGQTVSVGRLNQALRFLWSGEIVGGSANFVKLAIEGQGRRIDFLVNDKLVHTINDADIRTGDPGIFALSKGCFVFDDVSVYLPIP